MIRKLKNRDELRHAIIEWVKSKEITNGAAGSSEIWFDNSKGQPLLIFTSSVDKSEIYSDLFKKNKDILKTPVLIRLYN